MGLDVACGPSGGRIGTYPGLAAERVRETMGGTLPQRLFGPGSMDESCHTSRHTAPPAGRLGPAPGAEVFLNNLPYVVMIALGAVVMWLSLAPSGWSWVGAGLYAAGGVLSPFWIILFLCPHCGRYGQDCPCGYGSVAAALRQRRDPSLFRRKFRRHIPVIVPLWFAPLVAAGYMLTQASTVSRPLLASLAAAFAIEGFVILPAVSRMRGCGTCEQKADCPWMGSSGERQGRQGRLQQNNGSIG